MPASTNVNMLTVVHAGSTGMAMSFPDVCKTPSPAGPIPIPYPNIAQSTDTASGSKTVKVDGNPVMLKNSKFSMSTGDEAGSAGGGIMSNKVKGAAYYLNSSFDVKFDGQPVARLTDPMETNSGSPSNSACPAELQPPIPALPDMPAECAKLKKKEKAGDKIASKNSGMIPEHFSKIKKVVKQKKVILYIRQTKSECGVWITAGHQPKPHCVFLANTLAGGEKIQKAQKWLDYFKRKLNADYRDLPGPARKAFVEARISDLIGQGWLLGSNVIYSSDAKDFEGVIGGNEPQGKMKPLKAVRGGVKIGKKSYAGKWITADYDLFQVLNAADGCEVIDEDSKEFAQLKKAINSSLRWDAIQHGPQAQWVNKKDPAVDFPAKMKAGMAKGKGGHKEKIKLKNRNDMVVFDEKVTVIAPGGTLYLETSEQTFDALKCRDCG
jgi:uncharacterized Zn-binding protein involved in type VI secretion